MLIATWPKCQDKTLNILKTKNSFQDEIKSVFNYF